MLPGSARVRPAALAVRVRHARLHMPAAVWLTNKLISETASCTSHTACTTVWLVQLAATSKVSLFKHHTAAGSSFKHHTRPHAQPSMADSHSVRGGTQARGRRMRQQLNPTWLLHGVRLGAWRWSQA